MFFRSRYNLSLEILALRQQLGVLNRKHPRSRLRPQDRLFWILLRWFWSGWRNALIVVKPETVVAWWERWERLTGEATNSQNHPMMASVSAWF